MENLTPIEPPRAASLTPVHLSKGFKDESKLRIAGQEVSGRRNMVGVSNKDQGTERSIAF